MAQNPLRPAGTPPERGEEMRVITLWQPWASLVALQLKRFETRSWGTSYRGWLAIHAAQKPIYRDEFGLELFDKARWRLWCRALDLAHEAGILTDQSRLPLCHQLPLGKIVAICNLSDCYQMVDTSKDDPRIEVENPIYLFTKNGPLETLLGHWESGRFAWELSDVMELAEPIPFRGGQGLRRLDDYETLMSIAARLPMGGAM